MPISIPLLAHFDVDPLFFGLLVALNLQTAFLSPPVAMAAFYLKGVAPAHVTLNQIFAGVLPFMGIQCWPSSCCTCARRSDSGCRVSSTGSPPRLTGRPCPPSIGPDGGGGFSPGVSSEEATMIRSFVAGALVGGLVVWRWREEISRYLDDRTRGMRHRAADQLQSVEETAERVFDRTAQPLRRAESALDQAKAQVRDTLRAGQDAIRPGPESRD
jgi:hypothetical protein